MNFPPLVRLNAHTAETAIRRLTALVRRFGRDDSPPPMEAANGGWWVLACGEPLSQTDFAAREAARDRLLKAVDRAGIMLPENVWVWDETDRTQLVLATLPTLDRAEKVAERLRGKGLIVRIRRRLD